MRLFAEIDPNDVVVREFSGPDLDYMPLPLVRGNRVIRIVRYTVFASEVASVVLKDFYVQKPREYPAATQDDLWERVRAKRDKRLRRSDDQYHREDKGEEWRAAWGAYRAALRDLPSTTDDPSAIVWPKPPEV